MKLRGPWVWAAVIVPLWITLVLCVAWEPLVRDAWGNVNFYRWNKLDLSAAWHLVRDGWLGSNPRLGQTLTTLLYAPGPYHVIFTPILELGLFLLLTAITLGRRPSIRSTDDALVFVTVTALFALCTPQFGPMLFYRPFTGNYTFGLVLNLLWLVPYRFHALEPRRYRIWWAPLLLVLGVAAGMCNEHTGPAFLALGALAVGWSVKRGGRIQPWMIAGLIGLLAGYLLLMFAPGHDARYGGLAKQAGMIERITERGVVANLRIVGLLAMYLVWSVPWIVLGFLARCRAAAPPSTWRVQRAALLAIGGAGILATLALLASPKIGARLYVHSMGLLSIAISGWVIAQLTARWARRACALLSTAVLAYVCARCLITYRTVGAISADRVAIINRGPLGAHVVVPRYPRFPSKWFLGEDFGAQNLRISTAADYGLGSIELAGEAPPKR
ncbi:MAG: hypothetical protein H0T42_29330 [Deltaproteobacteria bacterium]|nr:hypothetical protein [Deltaproteobacteria bacterium]